MIIPIDGYVRTVNTTLASIHKELERKSWRGLFVEGWKELANHNSKAKTCAYKVIFVTGGVFTTGFFVASFTFGVLALKEGIYEIRHEGEGPIIGHFSEWTVQAFFAALFSLRAPYEIAQLGVLPSIETLYQAEITNPNWTREEQNTFYKEYLRSMGKQRQNSLVAFPHLPRSGDEVAEAVDLMQLDAKLQNVYAGMEKELDQTGAEQIKEGWKELKNNKTEIYIAALKVISAVSGVLLLGQFAIYGMGIYWSADQAKEDAEAGDNPSIGGHCLEWFAEMLAVGNGVFTLLGEVANIGNLKLKTEIFKSAMEKIEEAKEPLWEEKLVRLKEVMGEQIDAIPSGYFFSLPTFRQFW